MKLLYQKLDFFFFWKYIQIQRQKAVITEPRFFFLIPFRSSHSHVSVHVCGLISFSAAQTLINIISITKLGSFPA